MRLIARSAVPLACAISLALGANHATAVTITVTDGGDSGTLATCTLRQAIASANDDAAGASTCVAGNGIDTIEFAANLVNATITLSGSQLEITSPLSINGSGQTVDANKQSRVLYANAAGLNLSNLTVTGGSDSGGGGILASSGALQLDGVTVTKNHSTAGGGGISAVNGDLMLTNTIVSDNDADGDGGGMLVTNTVLTMVNTIVSGNTGANIGGGGFLSQVGGSASISQSTIAGNTANCTHDVCAAGLYAGGGSGSSGPVDVVDSTISGNTANGAAHMYVAAGAYFYDIAATLTNTTLAGNAVSGANYIAGALWEEHAASRTGHGLTLVNCTVSTNQATSAGPTIAGGILIGANVSVAIASSLALANSIVSANANGDVESGIGAASPTASYSLLGTALSSIAPYNGASSHNVFSDTPQLTPLQANGGPTMTLAPTSGSPAIDAGSNALATYNGAALLYDQRAGGYPRFLGARVDIGAVEFSGDTLFAYGFDPGP